MSEVISVENISKAYQLGQIGTGTLTNDLKVWWAKVRGLPSPLLRVGEKDHGNRDGETVWALKDINFTVRQGEVLGIIGRNGAGKSTLLKIMSQVTAPTAGQIKVKGHIASLLEVGTGFHPELTGRENVYLNGAILGMTRTEVQRKFDEIVDFSGVETYIDTPVKRYSSGMHVRLAFAVAAHLDPDILLVDEVLAVGDAEFQKKCLGKMSEVAAEGRTVLFVSHNMAAVTRLCTRGVLLDHGRVIFMGDQIETTTRYLSVFETQQEDLKDFDGRDGTGSVRFTKIELRDEAGNLLDMVPSGATVDVVMHYETQSNYEGNAEVAVRFKVFNPLGVKVFSQNTRYARKTINHLPRTGAFVCRISSLPLPPAAYRLACWIQVGQAISDKISGAAQLTVVEGDFYGTGWISSKTQGICLVKGDWRLEPN